MAVIMTGGKQYLVKEGDVLNVEKIKGDEKGGLVFDQVFLVADPAVSGTVKIGAPVVENAKVNAKIESEVRGKKITVLKYKSKTRYKVKRGHRQNYSKIRIEKIESEK
ncbi:50S ribosomal protein L21 [Patescibacteria group bacterium]|nr:50S ribosomal protein L21 [Patescibacteria group bacterium]